MAKKNLYFTKIVSAIETEKNLSKWLADNEASISKGALETAIYVVLGKGGQVPKIARELLDELRARAPSGGRGKPAIKIGDTTARKVNKLGINVNLKPYGSSWGAVGGTVDVIYGKDVITIRAHKASK